MNAEVLLGFFDTDPAWWAGSRDRPPTPTATSSPMPARHAMVAGGRRSAREAPSSPEASEPCVYPAAQLTVRTAPAVGLDRLDTHWCRWCLQRTRDRRARQPGRAHGVADSMLGGSSADALNLWTSATAGSDTTSTDPTADEAMTRPKWPPNVPQTLESVGRARLRKFVATDQQGAAVPVERARVRPFTELYRRQPRQRHPRPSI